MKDVNSTFTTEKNKRENKPVFLYTLYDYDGASSNLYFAEWDSDVTFDGVTYTRFPIKHQMIKSNTQGQIDTVQLTIGNVSRLIQAYLETYDLRAKKVKIRMVFSDQLADASAYIDEVFYIESYSADDTNAQFNLSSKFDVMDVELPNRRYMRNYCSWKFKGTECKYAGATSTCNKTETACRAMSGGSNIVNFGGFPGIPTARIYVS